MPRPNPRQLGDPGLPVLTLVGLLALGCSVVDRDFIDTLPPGPGDAGGDDDDDAGDDDDDVTPSDECGAIDTVVLPRVPAQSVEIDTRGLNDEARLTCAGLGQTVGADAFFAIDVSPNDYWHFHLTPKDEGDARDAVLYLLEATGGVCNTRSCERLSNRCRNFGAEHFGFRASPTTSGRFFIGVDDLVAGGGVYDLEIFRPVCGEGGFEHGEGCDGGEGCVGCRTLLSGDIVPDAGAVPPNTPDEALALDIPRGGGSIIIRGNADNDESDGFDECDYPDYFALNAPQGGTVEAVVLDRSGVVCDEPGDVPNVEFELRTPTLTLAGVSSPAPGTGCPRLVVDDLDEGQYLFLVKQTEELPINQLGYDVRLSVDAR